MWLFHAGAPLRLAIAATAHDTPTEHLLGTDLAAGQRPQIVVPAGAWQAAEISAETGAETRAVTGADFTLVSCTVTPGFEFAGFELADPGWAPGT